MHRIFWTFCSLLIVLTIISSIGGGIRYRENFMDTILDDMYDNVDYIPPNVIRSLTRRNNVLEEEHDVHVPHVVQAPTNIVQPIIPTPTPIPTTVTGVRTTLGSTAQIIEAFDGNVYATI